jgi:hypothetical protein
MIRTTKLTYSTYLEVVPWKALPSTFKHAIELTRRLGLRYVWIDSLCIVQDDAVDWRHEGSRMASIYAHSYITLVAAASKNARYGLYRPQPPTPFMEHQMQRKADQAPYSIYVHPRRDHYQFISNKLPLFKRAWFHQEHILSSRLVFFGESELYWECQSGQKCECGYMTEPPMTNTLADPKAPGDMRTWHDLVIRHTQLDLTFKSDIFPSLQGIASMCNGNGIIRILLVSGKSISSRDLCGMLKALRLDRRRILRHPGRGLQSRARSTGGLILLALTETQRSRSSLFRPHQLARIRKARLQRVLSCLKDVAYVRHWRIQVMGGRNENSDYAQGAFPAMQSLANSAISGLPTSFYSRTLMFYYFA